MKELPQGLTWTRLNTSLLRITFPVSSLAGVQPTKETDYVRALTAAQRPT